jgi:hypothetical protein
MSRNANRKEVTKEAVLADLERLRQGGTGHLADQGGVYDRPESGSNR